MYLCLYYTVNNIYTLCLYYTENVWDFFPHSASPAMTEVPHLLKPAWGAWFTSKATSEQAGNLANKTTNKNLKRIYKLETTTSNLCAEEFQFHVYSRFCSYLAGLWYFVIQVVMAKKTQDPMPASQGQGLGKGGYWSLAGRMALYRPWLLTLTFCSSGTWIPMEKGIHVQC